MSIPAFVKREKRKTSLGISTLYATAVSVHEESRVVLVISAAVMLSFVTVVLEQQQYDWHVSSSS
jgi:hypothetical protein